MKHRAWIVTGCLIIVVAVLTAAALGHFFLQRVMTQLEEPRTTRVPVSVDATVSAEDAWIASPYDAPWPAGQPQLVRVHDSRADPIMLQVIRRDARQTNERIELNLGLGHGTPTCDVEVMWYGNDTIPIYGPYEFGDDVSGHVTVDADRAPTPGDDRIVSYEVQARRDEDIVSFRGTIRLRVEPR